MTIIVTDQGFAPATPQDFVPLAEVDRHTGAVDLANTDTVQGLHTHLSALRLIRIAFPVVSDGRGFTLARRLREMGYAGTLRAAGALVADQYAMARRVGFDEVEISDETAARQPAGQWAFRADWQAHHYQTRLRA